MSLCSEPNSQHLAISRPPCNPGASYDPVAMMMTMRTIEANEMWKGTKLRWQLDEEIAMAEQEEQQRRREAARREGLYMKRPRSDALADLDHWIKKPRVSISEQVDVSEIEDGENESIADWELPSQSPDDLYEDAGVESQLYSDAPYAYELLSDDGEYVC